MQEVALTGGEEEELFEFNTDSEVPQTHAPENTMTEGPVHEQQPEPEQLQTPVVIPLEEDTSDVQPVDRPFRDKHYSYPYVRIVRWIYNAESGVQAEIQWHNTFEPVQNLTDEDRAEAQRLQRLHCAQRRDHNRPT
ncbi:hypothetical protein JG687_00015626 [Phytophthora cactorum]|uniref:Uncharacterized protein n=1 Tax=Phytophthora cactorum TaxID=29920 RepID=A0A329RIR1_9STRA